MTAPIPPSVVIAAALAGPRFAGRAEIVRAASRATQSYYHGDTLSQIALSLLSCTPRGREIAALRGEAGPYAQTIASQALAAQATLRASRAAARKTAPIPEPGAAYERLLGPVIRLRVLEAYRAAGLRRATHDHTTTIRIVHGEGRAYSVTSSVSPESVGLPRAYRRAGGYSVTSSHHTIAASSQILHAPESHPGALYLSATRRIVQGRGTSLAAEVLGPRGGWRRAA